MFGTEDESFFNEGAGAEEKRVMEWSGYPQNKHPTLQEIIFKYNSAVVNGEFWKTQATWKFENGWVRKNVETRRGTLGKTE